MKIEASNRVKSIGSYAFADVDNEVAKLKKAGITPIDFGVGDPKCATPAPVRNYCKRAIDKRMSDGYPSYIGTSDFRETIAKWTKQRFNVSLDPAKDIASSIGAKEAVFNFHEGVVNPGDYVIMPNPGYPPYERGTLFAEGKSYLYPLVKENNFLPDLEKIPADVVKKAKLMWINYPSNPTGAMITKEKLKEVIDFGHDNNIIIGSDECYSEIYFEEPPLSILELTREGVFAVQSLSKRSAMTTYRVGWLSGDPNVIDIFKKVKTNIDSGTPTFIQDAACAALLDEKHVEDFRKEYRKKRDMIVDALTSIGLDDCTPPATIYIWQKGPKGMSSVDFAKKLLEKDAAIVTTPGSWISKEVNGVNPGEGYVRLALVPSVAECKEAAGKIRKLEL
ncbi:MAG: aminotransferase class I/II-fold pyridoxal phosphate-dependent enzyme [Nanoarchaeota archaeon]|nr:aminotransferase class I/II-fold pyridoxal phosphate-dependent enzyme [Nanoarchaeota archaeon]MBU1005258.1 aminotransferase class I/II-fold pyridoxal phosphate-dependent enzyme [Nanoarchaeota archaeon]MBU1946521.1 aminotransferase class I/II-fold pyridoxal phosphate-dependent enzyme [Nanoarchaeota archaeon]